MYFIVEITSNYDFSKFKIIDLSNNKEKLEEKIKKLNLLYSLDYKFYKERVEPFHKKYLIYLDAELKLNDYKNIEEITKNFTNQYIHEVSIDIVKYFYELKGKLYLNEIDSIHYEIKELEKGFYEE